MATLDGPSPCGYHFINTYQKCPRSWYLRYACGLNPRRSKLPLLFGHAWHAALESGLLGGLDPARTNDYIDAGLADLNPLDFDKAEDFDTAKHRIVHGLPVWLAEARTELLPGELVESEKVWMVPLAGGFVFSVRMDGVWRAADGRVFILEHKSTAYSTEKMVQSVELSDQVTAYCLARTRLFPEERFNGVLLDVADFRGREPRASFWFVNRTRAEVVDFELGLIGLFTELSQKWASLPTHPPFELFPRNGEFCGLFGCEFEDVCRTRVEMAGGPPTSQFMLDQTILTETGAIFDGHNRQAVPDHGIEQDSLHGAGAAGNPASVGGD